jgi:hypothetical protein
MGFIDIIASKIGDTDEKAIGLIFTDTGGASYIAKNGRALQVLDATKEKFVDLREKKALSNFRPIKN